MTVGPNTSAGPAGPAQCSSLPTMNVPAGHGAPSFHSVNFRWVDFFGGFHSHGDHEDMGNDPKRAGFSVFFSFFMANPTAMDDN